MFRDIQNRGLELGRGWQVLTPMAIAIGLKKAHSSFAAKKKRCKSGKMYLGLWKDYGRTRKKQGR